MRRYHIAVVGATGAVGTEMFRVLERRDFPIRSIRALASMRSAGKTVSFHGEQIAIEELTRNSFRGIDIALFSAGGQIAREFGLWARDSGAIVIDNSSTFRMKLDVPLVIPEINKDDVKLHHGIIANPNCTSAIALMAIYPLHCAFNVKRVFAASYQAVSGSGARAIVELEQQVQAFVENRPMKPEVYPHPIPFNVLPQVDEFLETRYTKEEMKMQNEGRRIMHHPKFCASVTCVRVPAYRSHSVAVHGEFTEPVSVERAHEILAKAPGIELVDEPAHSQYPTPHSVAGKDN